MAANAYPTQLAKLVRQLKATQHGTAARVEVLSKLDDLLIDFEDEDGRRTKHARTVLLPELFESATRPPPTELYNLEASR